MDVAVCAVDVIDPARVIELDSRVTLRNPIPYAVPLLAEAVAVPLMLNVEPETVVELET